MGPQTKTLQRFAKCLSFGDDETRSGYTDMTDNVTPCVLSTHRSYFKSINALRTILLSLENHPNCGTILGVPEDLRVAQIEFPKYRSLINVVVVIVVATTTSPCSGFHGDRTLPLFRLSSSSDHRTLD